MERAVARFRWGKIALLGAGAGFALIVFLGWGGWFEQLGIVDIAILLLFASAVSDVLLAWENERAIAQGKTRLYNDVVGDLVVADGTFVAQGERFGGKVRLGMERWAAVSDSPVPAGEKVRISGRQGLVLQVERVSIAA